MPSFFAVFCFDSLVILVFGLYNIKFNITPKTLIFNLLKLRYVRLILQGERSFLSKTKKIICAF